MLIGRVVGQVVASAKHESHSGQKLLLVETLDLDNEPTGLSYIAVDAVDAGFGDRVLLTMDGWAAMTAVGRPRSPIDTAIIGVIDHVELDS